jgi:ABC-type dipeptide/oligopeptide/nickel transport system permease subunit
MVREGFVLINQDGYQLVPASVVVTIIILCFFVVGDALRDALGRG